MSETSHTRVPLRTCVGCRSRQPQSALVRFRRRPDGVVACAVSRRAGRGRGAYVCPSRRCFDRATGRRALRRSLNAASCEPEALWSAVLRGVDLEVECLQRSGARSRLTALFAIRERLHEA